MPAQCDQTYFRNLNNSINDIAWLGNDKLLAVGNSGSIIKSYDRGKNWRFIATHTASISLNAIQMVSDSIGYVVGSNQALLKTEDEGESWMAITPGMPPGFSSYTITQLRFSNTWTGAADQHWENAANWSCSQVPDENSSVSILSGTVIISSNVTVKQLFVESNAQLSVQPGNTLTITR